MSWVQFLGEAWESTDYEAELHLHLWPPLAQCPRQSWSLSLDHYEFDCPGPSRKMQRWLNFEIGNLHFHEPDWRRLSGLEIRGDAAWHEAHEHFHEYGRLNHEAMDVSVTYLRDTLKNPSPKGNRQLWRGHDFLLRLGQRDGLCFPCEIDAWLLPGGEYYRTLPETSAELARFGEGPPDLRILARAIFTRCTVVVPRSDDPIALARTCLREQIGLEEIHDPRIEWALRPSRDGKGSEPMPGWTSTVTFRTQPSA